MNFATHVFLDLPEDGGGPVVVVHVVDEPQEHVLQVGSQILQNTRNLMKSNFSNIINRDEI